MVATTKFTTTQFSSNNTERTLLASSNSTQLIIISPFLHVGEQSVYEPNGKN